MTDIATSTWPTGVDSSGSYITTVGTGTTYTPYTTTWTTQDYAEKKQLEAWMRILIERIEELQTRVKQLEDKPHGR